MAASNKDHRLISVDALRGIAITLVFVFHAEASSYPDRPEWFAFGSSGVALFFVLSGFSIHLSVARGRDFRIREFAVRRVLRIYPAYLVALFALTLAQSIPILSVQFILHASLLHNLNGGTFFAINPSFWSLAVECQLYLLYPALLYLRDRIGMSKTLVVLFCLSEALIIISNASLDRNTFSTQYLFHTPFHHWFDWAIGAMLAERFAQKRPLFPAGVMLPASALAVVVFAYTYEPASPWRFTISACFWAIITERVIYSSWKPAAFTPLAGVGIVSYSLYLWHQPLIHIAVGYISLGQGATFLVILMSFPAFVILAWVLFCVFESPFMPKYPTCPRPTVA